MSKRKYTHIKAMEQQIIRMREAGMTRQEIADELGLTKEQVKGWVKRYNRRGRVFLQECEHKAKGRPRKCKTSHSLRSSVYNLIKIKAETPSDNLPRYSADYLRVLFLL